MARSMVRQNVTVRMTQELIDRLEELAKNDSHFDDRSDVVRYAVREQLQKEAIDE